MGNGFRKRQTGPIPQRKGDRGGGNGYHWANVKNDRKKVVRVKQSQVESRKNNHSKVELEEIRLEKNNVKQSWPLDRTKLNFGTFDTRRGGERVDWLQVNQEQVGKGVTNEEKLAGSSV